MKKLFEYYLRFFCLSIFFLLSLAQNVLAFTVNPSIVELTALGKTARSYIQAINTAEIPLPIEIKVYQIELDTSGSLSKREVGDEFLIFPPQAMIAPGATQNFKIQWVGDPDIKKSQNYLFSVNQIPVKTLATKDKKVQVVFNHGVYVNVRPLEGTSELTIIKTDISKDGQGILRPIITVKNSGNIHARLVDASIHLSSADWAEKLLSTSIKQKVGVGLIQANGTRRFILNIDIPDTLTDFKALIDYKPWWRK